jgi:hypothetical protein
MTTTSDYSIKLSSTCFREYQKSKAPGILHHYTNQSGLLGIFGSGEFWATKIQYMNDTTEFEYAIGIAKKELEKRYFTIQSSIQNRLRLLDDKFPETRSCNLLQWMIEHLDAISAANICAVSFCTDPDLLSQWRGYASLGMGYAIGFHSNGLSEIAQNNACRLGPCLYARVFQERIINELIDEALIQIEVCWNNDVRNSHLPIGSAFERALLECGAFFKDTSFKEEQEWRLITAPKQYSDEVFRFREGGSMLIPYCTLEVRDDGSWANRIGSVMVGPCPHPKSARTAVEGLLMKVIGYPHPPVTVSKIPYRSW